MFTSVCTTSSYCRMLEGERGGKREKSQTGTHKVQLELSSPLLDLLQLKNKCKFPLCTSQDMRNQADSTESPKQGEPSASLEPLNEHSQPKGTKPIISPLRTGIQSRAQTTPGQARAKQPHSLLYFTCAPLGREGSAEEREQQPRTHGTATL